MKIFTPLMDCKWIGIDGAVAPVDWCTGACHFRALEAWRWCYRWVTCHTGQKFDDTEVQCKHEDLGV